MMLKFMLMFSSHFGMIENGCVTIPIFSWTFKCLEAMFVNKVL